MDYYYTLEKVKPEKRKNTRKKLYYVLVTRRIKEVINTASKVDRDNFQRYYPSIKKIKEKDWIPIDILDKACEINKKDVLLPLHFSELWFCLNRESIKRILPSGKIIQGKVRFYSVYLEHDDELLKILQDGIKIIGSQEKFGRLIERSQIAISRSLLKKAKLTLTSIIKACQILGINYWDVIEGKKLFSRKGDCVIFSNKLNENKVYLIEAINQEGHLHFSEPALSIKQNSKKFLEMIKDNLCKEFGLSKEKFILKQMKDKWKNFNMWFSSASLRQLLCLKFRIPLGYKCPIVMPLKLQKKELIESQLTSLFETEGSFTGSMEPYNFITPNFYFGSSNPFNVQQVFEILKMSDYNANLYEDRTCIQQLDQVVKLMFNILPYMKHHKKIENGLRILSQKEYILRLRIDSSENIKKLVKKAREALHWRKWGSTEKSVEFLKIRSREFGLHTDFTLADIYHWLEETNPPLLAIILFCNLLREDYFSYVPKHLGLLLWINRVITLEQFEELRGKSLQNLRNFQIGLPIK